MGTNDVLAGLDDEQIFAVTASTPLLAVIAGAGSGKTAVLTRRVAHRALTDRASAAHSVVVTFTRQASIELQRRLRAFGLDESPITGTFHSIALSMLRRHWDDNGRSHPTVVSDRVRLVGELLGARQSGRLFDLVTEVDWARARMVTAADYDAAASRAGRSARATKDVAQILADLESLKRKRGIVDLDDLLQLNVTIARDDPSFAAAIAWRLRHFYVDEAQDVNPLQSAVLDTWRAGRDDLTLVGDPNQAIYGFNGADSRLLRDPEIVFPGIEVVRLSTNYRCTPEIVTAGLGVLRHSSDTAPDLRSWRPSGEAPVAMSFADEAAEADGIAQVVPTLRPTFGRWSDVAVLTRTNAQLPVVRDALAAVGVPAEIIGSSAADPVQAAVRAASELTNRHALASWSLDTRASDDETDPADVEARRMVADAVDEYLADGGRDGLGFAAWVRANRPFHRGGSNDAVSLLTFHAAKGREWFGVVIAGADDSMIPHRSARTAADRDEEIRLAYVAVTRASDRLVFTRPMQRRQRTVGASFAARDLPVAPPPEPPSEEFLAGQRLRRDGRHDPDPVLDELTDWRRRAAQSSGVSPQMLCSDRTLRLLAERRPDSIDVLAQLPGVGISFAHRAGERILAAISRGLERAADPESDPSRRTSPGAPR